MPKLSGSTRPNEGVISAALLYSPSSFRIANLGVGVSFALGGIGSECPKGESWRESRGRGKGYLLAKS